MGNMEESINASYMEIYMPSMTGTRARFSQGGKSLPGRVGKFLCERRYCISPFNTEETSVTWDCK